VCLCNIALFCNQKKFSTEIWYILNELETHEVKEGRQIDHSLYVAIYIKCPEKVNSEEKVASIGKLELGCDFSWVSGFSHGR
jgi:hypothetical protein